MSNLWTFLKERPYVRFLVFIAAGVSGLVAFLSGLAGIWTAISRDTVPEFLSKRGWALTGWALDAPLLISILVLLLSVAGLVILASLFGYARADRATAIAKANEERDSALAELAQAKREHALDCLRRYGRSQLRDQQGQPVKPSVTIRFASYAKNDYQLVTEIERLFKNYTDWPINLDGGNVPALPKASDVKVMFETGPTLSFDELAWAFAQGDLLGVRVGKREGGQADTLHLVVKVFPTVS